MAGIRPFRSADTDALYAVCLGTGDDGEDASALYDDPRLLGEIFVGPYLEYSPGLAWVYADDDDRARGYVLGVLDSTAFDYQLDATWWPDLRRRHPLDDPPRNPRDRELVEYLHDPARRPAELAEQYPSHLHIDLLPDVQGGGRGGAMIRTLLEALVAAGSLGVHLGVARRNTRAIGFYEHLGFASLDSDVAGNELVMGRRLGSAHKVTAPTPR